MIMGASHTPPQPYIVPVQMEQLMVDYELMQETMHIVEAVATFHLKCEAIYHLLTAMDGQGDYLFMMNFRAYFFAIQAKKI